MKTGSTDLRFNFPTQWSEGYSAAWDGDMDGNAYNMRNANPYQQGTLERRAWASGFMEGEREQREER